MITSRTGYVFQIGDRVRLVRQVSRRYKIDRRQRGTVVGFGDTAGLVVFVSFGRIKTLSPGIIAICVSADDLRLW